MAGLLLACNGDGSGPETSPEIVAVSPLPDASSVSVLTELRVTFSQSLDGATVAGGLRLQVDGHPVGGTTTLESGQVVRFTPSSPLDFGEEYRAQVAPSVRGEDGTPVHSPPTWRFNTEGTSPPHAARSSLRDHVEALAHDSMFGRGSGTEYEHLAAEHIARFFQGSELETLNGTRVQTFTFELREGDEALSSQNVLGVVPGTGDLAGEWVVVGAHYDHVGVENLGAGDLRIYNGADDNASGTALVMELARSFASFVRDAGMGARARRSVLFAAWGAEEEGTRGSCHFTESGLIPLSSVTSTVNFDMVGMLRSNTMEALGEESSPAWEAIVADANRPDLVFENTTVCQSCSDHACFRKSGVPYLWFFTGWHDHQHQPSDDPGNLNYDGMARIQETAFRVLTRLAVMDPPPASSPGAFQP